MLRQFKHLLHRTRVRQESISAVHDDDLENFLTSIGAIHDINSGKIKCKFCKDMITIESIQAVIPDSGSVSYICNKPKCVQDLILYTKESE